MFDGNGNWVSDFSAISDRDNNIKILASRFDNIFIADIKESFENCLTKDGQIAPIGAFNMGGQKVTNLANGTNSNDAVNLSQVDTKIEEMLSALYPVGSVYIGTQSTCPMSTLISGSTWTLVSSGKALWTGTGSNANTTINAGLPNITGTFGARDGFTSQGGRDVNFNVASGSFYLDSSNQSYGTWDSTRTVNGGKSVSFNASRSSSIYGGSSTVQPPAYVVNVWRRTA